MLFMIKLFKDSIDAQKIIIKCKNLKLLKVYLKSILVQNTRISQGTFLLDFMLNKCSLC